MVAWKVFIKNHRQGYISWIEYERNQALLAGTAYGRAGDTKCARGGPVDDVKVFVNLIRGDNRAVYGGKAYASERKKSAAGQKPCCTPENHAAAAMAAGLVRSSLGQSVNA